MSRVPGVPSVPTGSWSAAVGESAVGSAAWSAAAIVRGLAGGEARSDLYKMVLVLNTHLPRLRTWRPTAKPAIWKSV